MRRLEVDSQLKLGRMLNRKVSRPRTLEYPLHIAGGATKQVEAVRCIGHEPTGLHMFEVAIDRWQMVPHREVRQASTVSEKHRVLHHDQRANTSAGRLGQGVRQLIWISRLYSMQCYPEYSRRHLRLVLRHDAEGISRIREKGDA